MRTRARRRARTCPRAAVRARVPRQERRARGVEGRGGEARRGPVEGVRGGVGRSNNGKGADGAAHGYTSHAFFEI